MSCPNCSRGYGLRLFPSLSATWRCGCGASTHHTPSTFLEAWVRSLLPTSILLGVAAALALDRAGVVAPASNLQWGLLVLFASSAALAGLVALLGPLSYLAALHAGIRFESTDKAKIAAAILAMALCCPPTAWFASQAILSMTRTPTAAHAANE